MNKRIARQQTADAVGFLWQAYAGLVLRGYDNEREIKDPILRGVWRHGKRAHQRMIKKP